LAEQILPEIITQRQNSGRRIRIWSAGCATGEEPYSIAMLLRDLIPDIQTWSVLILATDINRTVLRSAREGGYGAWSFRGVDKRVQSRYFQRNGDGRYHIADEIKRMVTFDYLNLIEGPYPSLSSNTHALDVIFCRNVTIYFPLEVTRTVVRRFHQCLVDGGWLVPGPSEPNMVTYGDFEHKSFPGTVVYRKSAAPKPAFTLPSAPATQAAAKPLAFQPVTPFSASVIAAAQTATAAKPFMFQPPAPVMAPPKPKPVPAESKAVEGPEQVEGDPYEVGMELLEAGQLDQALAKFRDKVAKDPHSAEACFAICKILANRGNLEEAQQWCERAIENDKLFAAAYYTLSMIHQEQGAFDKASDALKKTIYLDQGFVLAHYSLAHLYRRQGDEASARRALQVVQRLLESKPKDELIPEGDGLVAGQLLMQVQMLLGTGTQ